MLMYGQIFTRQKDRFDMRRISEYACAIALAFASLPCSYGADIDFSSLDLPAGSYWNGSDESGGFEAGGLFFNNDYEYFPDWDMESWYGWSYSNVTDTQHGFGNQYAAITGGGVTGPGSIYALAYLGAPNDAFLDLGGHRPVSMKVTNTAYAFHAMSSGDAFSRKFGPTDWFVLTITGFSGLGATGVQTGSTEFFLASGTEILSEWESIDLSSLAEGTRSLGFSLASSDNGSFGMNTPASFAMGSLTVAPEPGSTVLVLFAAGVLIRTCASRRMA